MLPSGATTIPSAPKLVPGTGNSVIPPAGVMRPTVVLPTSTNHTFPSRPDVIPSSPRLPHHVAPQTPAYERGTGYSTTPPDAGLDRDVEAFDEGCPAMLVQDTRSTRQTASATHMLQRTENEI